MFISVSKKICIHEFGCSSLFNRILLEDSTCIKTPQALKAAYSGSNYQYVSAVVTRIQLRLDILSKDYFKCVFSCFREHDATYADDILKEGQPGDMILPDLDYSIGEVFNEIDKADAFYISRFKIQAKVYSVVLVESVDLTRIFKQLDRKGGSKFESNFLIGSKSKLKYRVVCIRLPFHQIDMRNSKLQKNGNRNNKNNKQLNYLHLWNIFFTNLYSKGVLIEKVYKLFSLRWHI